jgi:hypothetical protein
MAPATSQPPAARRILLLEPDGLSRQRLVDALRLSGPFRVSVACTVAEACAILTQQPQDLALVTAELDERPICALRVVQPDLPVVLLVEEADLDQHRLPADAVQALLLRSHLTADLPPMLASVLAESVPQLVKPNGRERAMAHNIFSVDKAALQEFLAQVEWDEEIQLALISHQAVTLADWGGLAGEAINTLALAVDAGWLATADGREWSQLQFLDLPSPADAAGGPATLVIYTRSLSAELMPDYLLTLGAAASADAGSLRRQAGTVSQAVVDLICGEAMQQAKSATTAVAGAAGRLEPETSKNYAIIWQTAQPLASDRHAWVRQTIEHLAQANGCLLRHLLIRPDVVHLVVDCPPGRNAAWAAHLFKQGTQSAEPAGAVRWTKGHYATEAATPLSEAELNLFLEQSRAR